MRKKTAITPTLNGKVVLITGGAGLLGTAFVEVCAGAGATVVFTDTNKVAGEKLAHRLAKKSTKVFFHQCDITNEREVKKCISAILKRHKRIDALVNNAYPRNKNYGRKLEQVTYADFCENVAMHLGGYFLMTQQVISVMKKQRHGVIVNMGSIYGFTAPKFEIYKGTNMTTPVEYSAIKGAIINLTKYFASYLGEYNIRVNALSPGGVFNNQQKSFVKKYSERVVLGNRMAHVDDLTGALLFLLSDASRYMTGQNIVVDGGWSL